MLEKINEAYEYVRDKVDFDPEYSIILGTGLGDLINQIEIEYTLPYDDIPHFPVSTVESHHGRLVFGNVAGKKIVAMQGRFHYYEGYDMKQVTFPVRIFQKFNVRGLLVSNVSGSVNPEIRTGDLMILKDHINLLPENPTRGINYEELGPRFTDLNEPYKRDWISKGLKIAQDQGYRCHQGVYAAVQGPNLETPAEYRWLRTIGADSVGMSTVPEVLTAKHAGIPCFAISVITDEGFQEIPEPVTVENILEIAKNTEPKLTYVMKEMVRQI